MDQNLTKIAIIGGTGSLGGGLAKRWCKTGYPVIIGSRSIEKANFTAQKINSEFNITTVQGADYEAAASEGDIIVITVPFSSHNETLETIKRSVSGKIVVDTTVPLEPPKVGTVQLPSTGSAALITQKVLGTDADVVSALHNVAAHKLDGHETIDCDVLVCGNKRKARQLVIELVEKIGMRGLHAGPIENSIATEAMTSVLITINRHYKVADAGFKITGNLVLTG